MFDFHIHPSLKELLAPASDGLTPWDPIVVKLSIGKLLGRELEIGINSHFHQALNSQANLAQLKNAGIKLAGIVLYAVEKNLADGVLRRKIASKGKINLLDPGVLSEIRDGKSYYAWLCKNMESLLQHALSADGKTSFRFINSFDEFNESDENVIHGICLVEGAHCFMDDPESPNAESQFYQNLTDFQSRYSVRLFAMNLSHLQSIPFFNQAFGVQFIEDSLFYPTGSGISEAGIRIVKELYNRNILPDLKHLSWVARKQLIDLHKSDYPGFPLICSHAGLTGIPSRKRTAQLYAKPVSKGTVWELTHVKRRGHLKHSAFNHSSINLYDDEVVDILRSGGMIGLSMDQRILGYAADSIAYAWDIFPTDKEYISAAEAADFFEPVQDPASASIMKDTRFALTGFEVLEQDLNTKEIHYSYFINQLLHILWIAQEARIDLKRASTQICIGSDFDGLINPIDCCLNVTQLPAFKEEIKRRLKTDKTIWSQVGIDASLLDLDTFIEGVFYTNALQFLARYMK